MRSSESDSGIVEMLELSDQGLDKTLINMLRSLMEKVDKMEEQMGNVSREMETMKESRGILVSWKVEKAWMHFSHIHTENTPPQRAFQSEEILK